MTSKERDYLQAVVQLGCIACRKNGLPGTPAEVHHQRSGTGAGRRASHFDTMPLCPGHHRFYDDAPFIAMPPCLSATMDRSRRW